MSNYTTNTITGCRKGMRAVHKYLVDEKGNVDFNILLPMPRILDCIYSGATTLEGGRDMGKRDRLRAFVNATSGGEEFAIPVNEQLLKDKYGACTSYDWCCNYWGTKWNADTEHVAEEAISFATAWSDPEGIYGELFKRLDGDEYIEIWAYHEGGFGGRKYVYDHGEIKDQVWDGPMTENLVEGEDDLGVVVLQADNNPLCKVGLIYPNYPDHEEAEHSGHTYEEWYNGMPEMYQEKLDKANAKERYEKLLKENNIKL